MASSEQQMLKAEFEVPRAAIEVQGSHSVTPMHLIQLAMSQNADIGKLEKLMELQLRWEANESKKAFVAAMNAFKADPPEIVKNRLVAYEARGMTVSYKHATLDNVCEQVTERLSKYGISHRWKLEQTDAVIRVTCILTHAMGHSEETTLCGGPDDTGSKNKIQAISSTVTYLERYTLLAATGLATTGDDNDGQGPAKWDKLQEYIDSIATAPNLKVLEDTYKAGFKEAMAIPNTQAALLITKAKDERKAALLKDEPA